MARRDGLHLFVAVATAVVVTSSASAVINTFQVYSNGTRVAHTGDVKTALATLRQTITDAETGQRGYLITGDDRYLDPYRTGIAAIAAASERTDALTRDDAEQQRSFRELQPLLEAKLDEMAETVRARRTGGFAAADAIVRTDAGARTMGRIRSIVTEMLDREDAARQARRAEAL
jgi:CHASE3 domain sensor protein